MSFMLEFVLISDTIPFFPEAICTQNYHCLRYISISICPHSQFSTDSATKLTYFRAQ